MEVRLGKGFQLGLFIHAPWKGLFSSVYVDDIELAGKETKRWSDVESTQQRSRFGRTNIFLRSWKIGLHSKTMWNKRRYCGQSHNHVWIQNFRWINWKNYHARKICVFLRGLMTWKGMPSNVWDDIKTTQQLHKVSTSCMNDHHFKEEKLKSVGGLSKVCSQIVLKCLYWARVGRPDILQSVTKLARSITKWTKACDKRLPRLISYIHITHVIANNIVMWETLPNNADWDCFKTPTLQEILRTQNLHRVEHCAFLEVIHSFQSVGCVRSKLQCLTVQQNQKSFPWMLDWGKRVFPHLIYEIRPSQFFTETRIRVIKNGETRARTQFVSNRTNFQCERKSHGMIDDLNNVDFISSNVHSARQEALLCIFEDNEAVIKMVIKGRSPTMRHVSRTHRVALDWLFDGIKLDPKIQSKYNDTKNQLADTFTKEIPHLMNGIVFCVCSTSAISVPPIVLKYVEKNTRR